MPLTPGALLGPYEIVSSLGAGGMGEVYRARDTRLNRDVALKVLPESFANDPERRARLTREAQTLAALNHANIAQIHGLEESGGLTALVMEFVEGEDLSQRIAGRPIPMAEALPIARQIAEALQAAHAQGIVHRDLKPANIALTPDGQVKVLDFGLAKQGVMAAMGATGAVLESSPTFTSPALTQAGMILGTAAYMSPEQAQGRPADTRSDLWAFGCVLFEMVTGRKAFEADNLGDTLAAILRGEPDWRRLPASVPDNVRTLVTGCLERDRRRRIADASVALFLLNERSVTVRPNVTPARSRVVVALSIGAAVVATTAALWLVLDRGAPPQQTIRLQVAPPTGVSLVVNSFDPDLAVSPDGTRIVFSGRAPKGEQPQLFLRELGRLDATPVDGTTNARGVFFSPDGRWVAYSQNNDLKKSAIDGGPPVMICRACAAGFRGGSWGADDTIVFSSAGGATGLQRVAAGGGDPVAVTTPDRRTGEGHVTPEILPGGGAVLFTASTGGLANAQIVVRDLRTGAQTSLVRGASQPRYVAGGYLVFAAEGTLRAAGFDASRLTVAGSPLPLVDRVVMKQTGAANFGVSRNGTLVYMAGDARRGQTLAWLDRDGREEPIPAPVRNYAIPRLSPDGQRAAIDIRDQDQDIWIWDFSQRTLSRLTFDLAVETYPVWMPDGRQFVYASGGFSGTVFRQGLAGTGKPERLTKETSGLQAYAISRDGKTLVVGQGSPQGQGDLSTVSMDPPYEVRPLIHTPFNETNADISKDGRWIAYESNESGANEIYVRPFPGVDGGRWQVSTSGGTRPLWAPGGRELVFVGPDNRLMSVPVRLDGSFSAGAPAVVTSATIFSSAPGRTYDISPDGRRFLVIKEPMTPEAAPQITVVLNWLEELKQRVPTR